MAVPLQSDPYGRDLSCTDRIIPGRLVSGGQLLAEACYRRLITPRGQLLDDPTYGLAVCQWLGREMTPEFLVSVPGQIRNELTKDPRIEVVEVTVTTLRGASGAPEMVIDIEGRGVEGETFELSLHVSDVKVQLLSLS